MGFLFIFFIVVGAAVVFYYGMLHVESRRDGKFNKVIFVLSMLAVQALMVYALGVLFVLYVAKIATTGFWTYEVWEFGFSLLIFSIFICYVLLSRNENIHELSRRKYTFYSYAFLLFTSELVILYGYILLIGI